MSHDHLSLFSLEAFCFAMKSPNPLDLDSVTFDGAVTSELVFSIPNLKEGAVENGSGAADFGAFWIWGFTCNTFQSLTLIIMTN